MRKITILMLLFGFFVNAQNPLLIKDVTSSLQPIGNSVESDINFAKWNGKIFYSGNGGTILCVTDGTTAGTVAISTLGGSSSISTIIPAQDFVYIVTSDVSFSPTITSTDKIWKSDGTALGTSLVYSFDPAPGFSNVGVYYSVSKHRKNYSVDGNTMYFAAFNAAGGKELWKSDGTPVGTYMVKDIKPGTGSSQASGFSKIANTTLFIAQSVGLESKLWKTDGTLAGTEQIPVAEPFYIVNQDMAKLGNKVIFFAHNTVDGYEPYVSDGTAAGTFMLKNINPSGNSLTTQAMGLHLKVAGNYCYFIANNGTAATLWRTDGTSEGTIQLIAETNNTSDGGYSAVDAEKLWFINYDSAGSGASSKLIVTDGSVEGTKLVYSTLSYPQNLSTYNGSLWFQSRDVGSMANAEVWRTDGIQANTNMAYDVSSGAFSSVPFSFFELNGKLYFFGEYNVGNNKGLFRINGDFTFNGTANSDWNNKNNWNSNLTPLSTDNVNIPSGFSVMTTANAFAKNISVASPISLNAGNLDVYGNAVLSNSAKITLNANNLSLKGKIASLSGDATSYIVTNNTGKVVVENVDASRGNIVLPIGTVANYNPITLSNSGTADTFSARVETGIANNYAGETQGTAIIANAVNATWFINEGIVGGSNATVGLQWNDTQELSGFTRNTANLGHYNGTDWEGLLGSFSGGNPYTYTASGITSFSPFGILNTSLLGTNSFEINSFKIYPNPSTGIVNIDSNPDNIGANVEVTNILGQKIKSFELHQLQTQFVLDKGIYILNINKGIAKTSRKIIVQ